MSLDVNNSRERETGMLNAVFDRFLTIFEQIFTTATHPLDVFLNFQEIFIVIGVFLYVILIVEVGSISVRLSEYRVLCLHAVEQVLLCFAVITVVILAFAFAISGMPREAMICDIFRAYFAIHDKSMFAMNLFIFHHFVIFVDVFCRQLIFVKVTWHGTRCPAFLGMSGETWGQRFPHCFGWLLGSWTWHLSKMLLKKLASNNWRPRIRILSPSPSQLLWLCIKIQL